MPPLASHYAFELDEDDYVVRLKFISEKGEKLVQIPGCDGETCPIQQFARVVKEVVPVDWRRACKA